MLLPVLLGLLLGWSEPQGRFAFTPGPAWTTSEEILLEGQLWAARHAPSGGGAALRSFDAEQLFTLQKRAARQVGEVDVAEVMTADRIALWFAAGREGSGDQTVYVGPAERGNEHVGRHVFVDAKGTAWWQSFFRSRDQVHQLVAWAPRERFDQLAPAMRALEASISGIDERASLLYDSGEGGCAPARVERLATLRASGRWTETRELLRAAWNTHPSTASALALAELRATSVLVRHTEGCIQVAATQLKACRVLEGPAVDPASKALMAQAVACLDRDPTVLTEVRSGVAPWLP